MTADELDHLLYRAQTAPDAPCCPESLDGPHRFECHRRPWPATLRMKAREVIWLLSEVRQLRAERESLLLDREALRRRANEGETR